MKKARIIVDADFCISRLDRHLFGSFGEHMGRCVYTGIFEPGHPKADGHGFRRDVLELIRELGPHAHDSSRDDASPIRLWRCLCQNSAIAVMASIPTAAAYLIFQKRVTQGVMAAAGI